MDAIDFYNEVLKRVSIKDVLESYGMNINRGKTKCVFHNDNNPSMMINEKKNIAKCFACGVGGNPITFVKKYEKEINHNNISTNEAIIMLVDKFNLDLDVSSLKDRKAEYQYRTNTKVYNDEEKKLLELNDYLSKLFSYNLFHQSNKEALDYLHNRGLSDDMIKEMNLGFCLKGQLLSVKDNSNSKLNKEDLKKLGFFKDNGTETFQDRIMFPIKDEKGNIITFAGRTMEDEKPKYLHTGETSIFHKSELLYNFSDVKNLSYNDEIFIVEGYMDVIGAKKIGMDNVVALMGTALTEEHLKLLKQNNSSLILALDNDEAGHNAMLNKIPELLKQDYDVSVLDISKLGDYKDLGDISKTHITREMVYSTKVSGFTFLMDRLYFKDRNYSVDNIYKVFNRLNKEKIITNTLDRLKFIEYLEKNTNYNIDKINEIIDPKSIDELNPLSNINNLAIKSLIVSSIDNYISNSNDKTLSSYYNLNKDKLNKTTIEVFNAYDVRYLNSDNSNINIEKLLDDVLNLDSKYSEYKTLNSFQYENVFDKTYIKNINGSAVVNLSFEQKQKIIDQFDRSFISNERLALEEVEELYIVNDISDLDGILNYDNKTVRLLKENIQNRMFLNQNKMDFFKFGNIFQNVEKEFISNEFKGSTGNFKTILLYNNLSNTLTLSKDNIVKTEINNKSEKVLEQDYIFSINKVLLVKELETETSYFIRIPNTEGKDYFYIDKEDCNWANNNEMLFTKLEANKTYKIYDKSGNFKYEKTSFELKKYWEDKTKKEEKKTKKEERSNIVKVNFKEPYTPIKEPISKVYKSKIYDETENGFYIRTDDPNVLLFASKRICNWNQEKNFLIIHPRKNFLRGTDISKYNFDGENKKFMKKLSYNEIENYLKLFYPASLKKSVNAVEIPKEKCNIVNNFVKIPITLDSVNGYIDASVFKCIEKNNNIVLEFTKNEKLSFYAQDGSYIGNYSYEEINEGLKKGKAIKQQVQSKINFNDIIDSHENTIFYSDNDILEFETTMIEPTYEYFETVTCVKLNGNYLYKPEGVNIAAYKNKLIQKGVFKTKEDTVKFLESYFQNRELTKNTKIEKEREVA